MSASIQDANMTHDVVCDLLDALCITREINAPLYAHTRMHYEVLRCSDNPPPSIVTFTNEAVSMFWDDNNSASFIHNNIMHTRERDDRYVHYLAIGRALQGDDITIAHYLQQGVVEHPPHITRLGDYFVSIDAPMLTMIQPLRQSDTL